MRTTHTTTMALRDAPTRELLTYLRGEKHTEGMTYRVRVRDVRHVFGGTWPSVLLKLWALPTVSVVTLAQPTDDLTMTTMQSDDPPDDAWCIVSEVDDHATDLPTAAGNSEQALRNPEGDPAS